MIEETVREAINTFFDMYKAVGDYVYQFYFLYSRIILDYIHAYFKIGFNMFIFLTVVLASFYLFMSIAVLFKKKTKSRGVPQGKEPSVTVQIPTYNELAALNCAKKCLEFDYPKDRLQIIIGDDSNDKKVSDKIDRFANIYPDIVKVTRRGSNAGFKPGNLNHMLKYTKGEYIVIFDSDFLPEKDFLRKIIAPFKDRNVSVVQSRWKIYNFNQNFISVLGGTISMICHNISLEFINWFKGSGFLCGSGEAIRKKDLIAVGGWQTGSLTEDIECSLRLIKKGKRLVYVEDVECKCEAPYMFKDLCKQQMRWAYGVILAIRTHLSGLLGSRRVRAKHKLSVFIFASGYMFSFLLLGITMTGILSVISNRPAPIDWARFLSETGINIMLTSGFLLASVVALGKARKVKMLHKMVACSLSVGLAVTYYVNVGILKALFGRQMQWFMLNKNGNETTE